MKVSYDKETDSLTITLRDERIKESDEIRPGVIADFGYDGGVVRFEITQASNDGSGKSSIVEGDRKKPGEEGSSFAEMTCVPKSFFIFLLAETNESESQC